MTGRLRTPNGRTIDAPATLRIGCGWTGRAECGLKPALVDVVVSAYLLGADGKMRAASSDLLFYSNPKSANGSIVLDYLGELEGDDSSVVIKLAEVPHDLESLAIVWSLEPSNQGAAEFGMITDTYVRLCDAGGLEEFSRFDFTIGKPSELGLVVIELCRNGFDWEFKPVMDYIAGGIRAVSEKYGFPV